MRKTVVTAVSGLLVTLVLSSCEPGLTAYQPQSSQKIGTQTGDFILTENGAVETTPVTMATILRVTESDGHAFVCGAIVIAGNKWVHDKIAAMLLNPSSFLTIGKYEIGHDYANISPKFLHTYSVETDQKQYKFAQNAFSDISGNCIQTEWAWKPELKTAAKLNLIGVHR